jgi:hypothetical protein
VFALPEETNKVCIIKLKQEACRISPPEYWSVLRLTPIIRESRSEVRESAAVKVWLRTKHILKFHTCK